MPPRLYWLKKWLDAVNDRGSTAYNRRGMFNAAGRTVYSVAGLFVTCCTACDVITTDRHDVIVNVACTMFYRNIV